MSIYRLIHILVITIFFLTPTSGQELNSSLYRLPETIKPISYNISLQIYPERNGYFGSVNLTFYIIDENTTKKSIFLHADADFIFIQSAVLNDFVNCDYNSSNVADILEIACSTEIKGNNYLYIEYAAKFSDGFGMLKSTYSDLGTERIFIVSNFKPTYARRAFPCFDEPSFRARFSIQVSYPDDYRVLSDTLATDTERNTKGKVKTTRFEDTPEISPYLVSLLISKLEPSDLTSSSDTSFKLFTRADVANLTHVAASYHGNILENLRNYTGIGYQDLNNTECYHVSVPEYPDTIGEFGLFVYRERDLLDEAENTTCEVTQDIITTMAYKLIHEWYGGSVSTKWWSDIWVNEAVATYLKYIIADQTDPNLDLYNQFAVGVRQKYMQYDALRTAAPLSSKENDILLKGDIQHKLDDSSYQKGAALLHMISLILGGQSEFKTALQTHWKNREGKYSNGAEILDDLIGSDNKINTYLKTWTLQSGFPVLNVVIYQYINDSEIIILSQKRFAYPIEYHSYDLVEYAIPLTFCRASNLTFDNLRIQNYLEPASSVTYSMEPGSWIIFNLQGRLPYRVNYDDRIWERVVNVLRNESQITKIHVLNRAQLVDDLFNVARLGDQSYRLAFSLMDYMVNETEYYPWYSAFNAFSYLLGKLETDENETNLRAYILDLMKSVIETPFISSNKTHMEILKQVMFLKWACYLRNIDCVNYAGEKFRIFKQSRDSFEEYDLREIVLCTGLRHSNNTVEDWNFLWSLYNTSLSVHEKDDILMAMGCVDNEDLLEEYLLKIVITESGIKTQDAILVFKSVFSSDSIGLQVGMEFLENKFDDILSSQGIQILKEMVKSLAEKLITDDQFSWLKNILARGAFEEYKGFRDEANALTAVNNYWARHYRSQLTVLFANPTTIQSSTTTPLESTTIASDSTTIASKPTTRPSEWSTTPSELTTTPNGTESTEIESTTFISTTESRSVSKHALICTTILVFSVQVVHFVLGK